MVKLKNRIPDFLESELEICERLLDDSLFHIVPVPLEQSVSYGGGTVGGPGAILEASQQLEAWDGFSEPLRAGIVTQSFVDCGGDVQTILDRIESAVKPVVGNGKIPVLLGGEHTVSLGAIRALASKSASPIGIIQLDAHADLRQSYEGLMYSHACVMRRAIDECGCRLFQFGVRALCREEVEFRALRGIEYLDGRDIPGARLADFSLPADFPEDIYLTLDVDGIDPSVIAATGTPVPGGPGWYQTLTFLERALAGRRVLGFDLVELAPRKGDHVSDFSAAQLIYSVMGFITRNQTS